MKRFIAIFAGIMAFSQLPVQAVDKQKNSVTTGDESTFVKITLSSTTATSLGGFSFTRGALTCVNSDSSNAVWIGSSTVISAAGAASYPLYSRQTIQLLNNSSLFGIADTGVASVVVYCITER